MGIGIALASSKGGSGKSTLTMLLAGEFAHSGLSVMILDTDPQGSIVKWQQECIVNDSWPQNIQVEAVSDQKILFEWISRSEYDVTLVDVQGTSNPMMTVAASHCDLVVIPCIASRLDSSEVWIIPKYLEDCAVPGQPSKPYRVVLNAVSGLEQKTDAFVEVVVSMSDAGIQLANTIVSLRQHYRSVAFGRGSLYNLPKKNEYLFKAISNISALSIELLGVVNSSREDEPNSAVAGIGQTKIDTTVAIGA